jgi:hypothetical protein
MFFEFRVGAKVMLFNLTQVTEIKVEPPVEDLAEVTFFFADGRAETVSLSPTILQRLNTSIPRPTIYGYGGMG